MVAGKFAERRTARNGAVCIVTMCAGYRAGARPLAISAISGLFTSVLMSFVGLAVNYGFHADFVEHRPRAAAIGYVTVVPILFLLIRCIQRFVVARAA